MTLKKHSQNNINSFGGGNIGEWLIFGKNAFT